MLRLLLLSALAVGLVLAHKGDDDDDHQGGLGHVFGDVASPVIVANGLRIIGLAKKLERVKEKLKKAEEVDPQRFLNNLRVRVDDLEGKLTLAAIFSSDRTFEVYKPSFDNWSSSIII